MSEGKDLHLFDAFGIELEYMIVGSESLDVLPVADRVLRAAAGEETNEVERDALAWSNELALHVIELKTNGPVAALDGLSSLFTDDIREINRMLEALGGRLLPGAMHPWMDPARQTKLWPHGDRAIYQAYDRIFTCQGHGWSNLQSVHLNIGFCGDDEFGRLHAAIRLLLPILPALAASSPVMDGKFTGIMDNRLQVYRNNQVKVPSVTGRVIPEAVFSKREYEEKIFEPISDLPGNRPLRPGRDSSVRMAQFPWRHRPFRAQRHRDSPAGHPGMPAGRSCHKRRHHRCA